MTSSRTSPRLAIAWVLNGYEAGDLLPSRAITSALILLDHDPAAIAILKNGQGNSEMRALS
ncbi:hypothetical protein [Nostoc sp.]